MNTRFAPSPTGDMHVGNLRAAIMPYLYAKKHDCKFILRIDDTDTERSKEYYMNGIYEDLKWLGIEYDYTFKQSTKKARYQEALELCIKNGLVYEVYDNEDELEELRKKLNLSRKPPAYKREHAKYIENRAKYWRFDIGNQDIVFHDIIKGKITTPLSTVSDPVACKPNGDFTYTFASIIDDIYEEISCIIRAVEHLTNTAVQLKILQELSKCGLGQQEIKLAHYPLFCGPNGQKFSKRLGNFSLTQMKQTTHPLALFHYITFLGQKGKYCSLDELPEHFNLQNYASSNLIEFNISQINKWQNKVLANLSHDAMQKWCEADLTENQWHVVRDSVSTKADILSWETIFNVQRSFLINSMCFNQGDDHKLTRKLLTNQLHGPKIDDILAVMDEKIAQYRLDQGVTELDINFTNTLTGLKEKFIAEASVSMYSCGPTVYDLPHIGNLRSFIVFDVLYRFLLELFNKVKYVRNITDIDDKIILRATEQVIEWTDLTKEIYKKFKEEMELLNLLPPTHEPKVTENIAEIIDMIKEIISHDIAYIKSDGVYFSIEKYSKFYDYDVFGCLKNHASDEKDDFVLWKFRDAAEVGWSSPWGHGRPGWHIECSAMARKFAGESFDIHCGGKDLIFPHHTNEICQSAACNLNPGYKMAKYWLHNNFINISSEKMSKSLNNMLVLSDLNTDPMIVRLALLMAHYRHESNWNDNLLIEAKSLYNKWRRNIGKVLQVNPKLSNGCVISEFIYELCDDLNTPAAIRVLDKITVSESNVSDLLKSFSVLGIKFDFDYLHNREIKYLVEQRQEYRKSGNFADSDKVRNQLSEMGVELEENRTHSFWYQNIC
jgi:cysteinyl-tRNA synthetase